MAIAGIVLSVAEGRLSETREALRAFPGIVDVQELEDDSRLAAVLESPSRRLQADLESLNGLDHVRQLDVAYVNYEEDLDGQGHMACPPHCARGPRRCVSVPEGEPS